MGLHLDLPYLLDMKVDKYLFRALAQFWNSAYSCFTFRKVDLVPTIKEYMALLRCSKIQVDRIYSKAVSAPFLRRLTNITVIDLFDRLDNRVTPVPAILAKMFRLLNACRRVFSEKYSPLKEVVATPRRDDISMEK
ncbi:hypothetical protein Goklo_000034 [Gossypium klotzschianum]|uniref:DUF7745 domain-containing protein n=1 Tax=Gossypium klotzschianum TaxID=34286 RepID=A0A7J8WBX8_9ROSI|nr:hypothetical protein [Gossypium klotzschianum]